MKFIDINEAFYNALTDINEEGIEQETRGLKFKEITDYSFEISDPKKRILTIPYRYNNIAATIAETFWVFNGQNDMHFLTKFLPNATDYSDDGHVWRGAYGPRMRNNKYDQIKMALLALQKDLYTRQAIITIPLPPDDYNPNFQTKDRPCTMFVQFLYRNGGLRCYVRIRSNDAIWGAFNINVFEWTFLQEVFAGILGVKLGPYCHNAVSMHYYDKMYDRVKNILDHEYNVYTDELFTPDPIEFKSLKEFYNAMADFRYSLVTLFDKENTDYIFREDILAVLDHYGDRYLGYFCLPVMYVLLEKGDYLKAINVIEQFLSNKNHDLKIAGLEYIYRWMKKKYDPYISFEDFVNDFNLRFSSRTIDFITQNWKELEYHG